MNEEQQKADKELLKELSGRFVKAYSDHEFKLILEAQARITRAEERDRVAAILKYWECVIDIDNPVSIETLKKEILSSNKPNNE